MRAGGGGAGLREQDICTYTGNIDARDGTGAKQRLCSHTLILDEDTLEAANALLGR